MEHFKNNYNIKLNYGKSINALLTKKKLGQFDDKYNANIIFNPYSPEKVQIQIFYNPGSFLYEKLEFLDKKNIDLISGISIYDTREQSPHVSLDLSECKFLNLKDDDCIWENGFRFVIVDIDSIKIKEVYKSADENYAIFTLHENAISPIDLQYEYVAFDYYNPEKFEAKNIQDFLSFGHFRFRLEFDFYLTYFYKDKINIKSVPRLKIRSQSYQNDDISHEEIINYTNILCLLLSLYYNREIAFFHAKIFQPENVLTFIKHINIPTDISIPKPFNEKYNSFYDFVYDCDYSKIESEFLTLSNIVSKLILSSRLDGVSEFMILYNILEIIRNFYLSKKIIMPVKENISFKTNRKIANKIIRSKLSEISEIIHDDEKDNFILTIDNKVEFIKRKSMSNQFKSLFVNLKIDLKNNYGINFKEIIKMRDKIYHGSIDISELANISDTNEILRRLIKNLTISIIK